MPRRKSRYRHSRPSKASRTPYSLTALWQSGDFVARGTIIILVIMSMGTWYVLITKFIEQTFLLRQAGEANRKFWNAKSIRDGANGLGQKSAFRMVVEDGLNAAEHHEGKLTAQIDRHTWITMSLQRSVDSIANRMQSGLAVLATVGSTAPFVGLFGTVWGIYHALTAIGIAGQASIDKVAGPVGEALIMTAIGLAVAVPAVLAYNWMVRRNKVAMDQVRSFSGDLLALLIVGARPTLRRRRGAPDMAMMGLRGDNDEDTFTASINTTPLVDIMLVLLIIFLITVPVVTHSFPVALPHETNQPTQTRPDNIVIAVDKDGNVYWNDAKVADNDTCSAR